MTRQRIGRRIVRYDTIGSTMEEAARLTAAGEPEGTIVLAAEQTAGRGRAGRSWIAPPGSALLCSVLLRPPVAAGRLPVLSLVIGAAAADAIEAATGLSPRLKWPNDLWLGDADPGRKVGGVLLTARVDRDGIAAVVAGIGINVTASPAELPPGATSLAAELGRAIAIEPLFDDFIECLNGAYDDFLDTRGHPSLETWRQRAALVGQEVSVTDGDQQRTGRFTGIDDDGRLLLADEQGVIQRIIAGDLTRGPRLGWR